MRSRGRTLGEYAANAKRILDGAAAEHAAIARSARWIDYSRLWVPSHSGWCAVCLQAQNQAFFDSVASNFTGVNSEPLCYASQNG
jgi:hypothetical protein